jgi:beta-phosphoglucomutase
VQSNKIKLIIFDLDGVLTETSSFHFQAWKSLANDIGINLDPSFEVQLKGVSRNESLDRILNAYPLDHSFSKPQKEELLKIKNNHYLELISHMTRKDLFDGVIQLFDFLSKHYVKIALGSASKNATHLLEILDIKQYFDYIVNPRDLSSKPKPDIFLNAMNHFNLEPSECIGIEDAVAGVKAINKANMISIGIGSKSELTEADYCFKAINEIPFNFLKSLLKGESS